MQTLDHCSPTSVIHTQEYGFGDFAAEAVINVWGMDIAIRPARLDEISTLAQLVNVAYRGQGGWTSEYGLIEGLRVDESTLTRIVSSEGFITQQVILVAEQSDGTPVGTVHLQCNAQDPEVVFLGMLSVKPEHQNKRLGAFLLNESQRWIREKWPKVETIEIGVISQRTELISWYERRNFCRTGASEEFPYNDPSVGKPLRPDLAFVILRQTRAMQNVS